MCSQVSVVDDASLVLNYSSSHDWSMSANLDVEVLFESHAFVPMQVIDTVDTHTHSAASISSDRKLYIPGGVMLGHDSKTRMLQQFDSAVMLKSGQTREGDGDTHTPRDGHTHTHGKIGTRLTFVQHNDDLGGDVHDQTVDSEMVSTKAAEVQTDRVEDVHQALPMEDVLAEEKSHASLSVQDVITLARVKPLGVLSGSSGRCIGEMCIGVHVQG